MPCDALHLGDEVATFSVKEIEAVHGGYFLVNEIELLWILGVGGLHQHDNQSQIQVGML